MARRSQAFDSPRLIFKRASSFKTKAVDWLWKDRIPLGELTLVAGREGTGKGLFMSDLIARITAGKLSGQFHGKPRPVAIVAKEDSWEKTVAARLKVAGADMDLVYRLSVGEADGERHLVLPDDLPLLAADAAEMGVVMLALDPLISVIDSSVDLFKSPKVRPVLEEFRQVLEETNIAGLGIMHFNKMSEGDSLSKIANARAFVEVARAAFIVAEDKESDTPGVVVVSQPRNNLGRTDLPSLAYQRVGIDVRTDDGRKTSVGKLKWFNKNYHRTADDALLAAKNGAQRSSSSSDVVDWVLSVRREVSPKEVAAATGIEYTTVRQALVRAVANGKLQHTERGRYMAP